MGETFLLFHGIHITNNNVEIRMLHFGLPSFYSIKGNLDKQILEYIVEQLNI